MESKTSIAVSKYKSGDRLGALRIFKTFRLGISKENQQRLEIAYQMMIGNDGLYLALGYKQPDMEQRAWDIIEEVWCSD
jgi:hypothetical protein